MPITEDMKAFVEGLPDEHVSALADNEHVQGFLDFIAVGEDEAKGFLADKNKESLTKLFEALNESESVDFLGQCQTYLRIEILK